MVSSPAAWPVSLGVSGGSSKTSRWSCAGWGRGEMSLAFYPSSTLSHTAMRSQLGFAPSSLR